MREIDFRIGCYEITAERINSKTVVKFAALLWKTSALWCVQTPTVLHRPMLVFGMATHVMPTNIHNAANCCERLALEDVDRCTAMKSECTIILHMQKGVWN